MQLGDSAAGRSFQLPSSKRGSKHQRRNGASAGLGNGGEFSALWRKLCESTTDDHTAGYVYDRLETYVRESDAHARWSEDRAYGSAQQCAEHSDFVGVLVVFYLESGFQPHGARHFTSPSTYHHVVKRLFDKCKEANETTFCRRTGYDSGRLYIKSLFGVDTFMKEVQQACDTSFVVEIVS